MNLSHTYIPNRTECTVPIICESYTFLVVNFNKVLTRLFTPKEREGIVNVFVTNTDVSWGTLLALRNLWCASNSAHVRQLQHLRL